MRECDIRIGGEQACVHSLHPDLLTLNQRVQIRVLVRPPDHLAISTHYLVTLNELYRLLVSGPHADPAGPKKVRPRVVAYQLHRRTHSAARAIRGLATTPVFAGASGRST